MQCEAPEQMTDFLCGGGRADYNTILTVDGLRFGYGSEDVLESINIDVGRNEFVALLGPNGSGKTTLMRCINKVVSIREGVIKIDGKDVDAMSKDSISRLCTTVPADIPTDFSLSTKEFVSLGRYPYITNWWWESKEDNDIVEKTMYDFGILHYANRRIHELSSGERARALLAKGVVQEPRLIMVDEPSAHLDIKYKVQVMEMLRGLSRSGLTVIMASHDLNLASRYCDKAMLLHKGRIVAYGPCAEVMTPESIREVFDIDVKVIHDHGIPYIIPTPPSEGDIEFKVELPGCEKNGF